MSRENPNEASKDLASMTDQQLKKLEEETATARPQEDQMAINQAKGLQQFTSQHLFRIVKDMKLSFREATMILRVAENKRARGDLKAQQVIDELKLRVLPRLMRSSPT